MAKDTIQLPEGWTKEQVLNKIQSEYMQSEIVAQRKVAKIRRYIRLYNDPDINDEEKLRINLGFSNIRTLMALSIVDDLTIKYIGQNLTDFQKADNWNKLAEDMYNSVGMTMVNIESKEDRFLAGVSLRSLDKD